ncbi:MAG: hypothetical protein NUV59_02490 [Patescibacteria group bacterium]|nr:hypothetical protein [Patescibacteria group bacterium]
MMSVRGAWDDILKTAVLAPSGDNAQPWSFALDGDTLNVYNLSDRDPTLYNFKQRGSYLAHGALAENISISAAHAGYVAVIEPFPKNSTCTMRISLKPASARKDPLYDAIHVRTTNRKPYDIRSLAPEDRTALLDAAAGATEISLKLAEERDTIRIIAENVSANERLLFEHRPLHDFLFGVIRWTENAERVKPGLYIKTMEFPTPLQYIIKYALRHWPVVQTLNKIGLSRAIARDSAKNHMASSAIGAIVASDYSDIAFMSAGRTFQRVWLTAASRGLSIQPITAISYLMQRVNERETASLSEEHIALIRDAAGNIGRAMELKGREHIAMLFRIGYDGEPTARSSKLPPTFQNKDA